MGGVVACGGVLQETVIVIAIVIVIVMVIVIVIAIAIAIVIINDALCLKAISVMDKTGSVRRTGGPRVGFEDRLQL